MNVRDGVSLEVPDFFTAGETADALAALEAALGTPVTDSGLRRCLSSYESVQPIQAAIHVGGEVGLHVLGIAGWAAIVKFYAYFRDRYGDRPVSIDLVARDDKGHVGEYQLTNGTDDHALQAIPADLGRSAKGVRVQYDVDEGWLTWEEANEKRRRHR